MNIPKIENMTSPRTGKDVPNQFRIYTQEGVYFQSYQTIIAFDPNNGSPLQLDERRWDYSVTTSKYRNAFTGLSTRETQQGIDKGTILLTNLNPDRG